MHHLWQAWANKMPPDWCDDVTVRAMSLVEQSAVIGTEGQGSEIRTAGVRWFDPIGKDRDISGSLRVLAEFSNRVNFGFDLASMWELQFAQYDVGGKYDWHHDVFFVAPQSAYQRKLSVVVQLSVPGSYEGGVFQFGGDIPQPEPHQFMGRGSVLIFPSFFPHRVTPVTRGTRLSLTGWIEGPAWR